MSANDHAVSANLEDRLSPFEADPEQLYVDNSSFDDLYPEAPLFMSGGYGPVGALTDGELSEPSPDPLVHYHPPPDNNLDHDDNLSQGDGSKESVSGDSHITSDEHDNLQNDPPGVESNYVESSDDENGFTAQM